MAKGKIAPIISTGSSLVSSVAGSNPYVAALTSVVDIGTKVAQRRAHKAVSEVDDSAKNFTTHTLTFSAAGEQRVAHLLDKTPGGFSVVSKTAACDLFIVSQDDRFITFDAGGTFPCTFELRIH